MGAAFLWGMAAGIMLHRAIMAFVLKESPDSLCAYCKWLKQKRNRRKGDGPKD